MSKYPIMPPSKVNNAARALLTAMAEADSYAVRDILDNIYTVYGAVGQSRVTQRMIDIRRKARPCEKISHS